MTNFIFVDEDGDEINVYDNEYEIEGRAFDQPDRSERRFKAELYAKQQAARLGCGWGPNY